MPQAGQSLGLHRSVFHPGRQQLHRLGFGHTNAEIGEQLRQFASSEALVHALQGQGQRPTCSTAGYKTAKAGQQHHRLSGRQGLRRHQMHAEGIQQQRSAARSLPVRLGCWETAIAPFETSQWPLPQLAAAAKTIPGALVTAPAMHAQQLPVRCQGRPLAALHH